MTPNGYHKWIGSILKWYMHELLMVVIIIAGCCSPLGSMVSRTPILDGLRCPSYRCTCRCSSRILPMINYHWLSHLGRRGLPLVDGHGMPIVIGRPGWSCSLQLNVFCRLEG